MNLLHHPGVHQIPESDIEKKGEAEINITANTGSDTHPIATHLSSSFDSSTPHDIPPTTILQGALAHWNAKVEGLTGVEARGITRVLPEERQGGGVRGYLQMLVLWFSINLEVLNLLTGLLGPLVFQLGWVDSVCIVIFANALASCAPAYMSTFAPESGNRTMVCANGLRALVPLGLILEVDG